MEKVVVIVGASGIGKSAFGIQLAKHFNGEIISGDSMQVYRELNIGSAKLKAEEMQGVPHFLIDSHDIDEAYHVANFQKEARYQLSKIKERNKLPFIVGGSGLYIKAALYDYQFLNETFDQTFHDFLQSLSTAQRFALLRHVDYPSSQVIHKNNTQRIIRALEMAHVGKVKSEILKEQEHTLLYDALIIGLALDRDKLYDRIEQRVDRMMDEGLLGEVEALYKKYPDVFTYASFQGIGYAEWRDYFEKKADQATCIARIKKHTRNLAKRQDTWFKNQLHVQYFNIEDKHMFNKVNALIQTWLQS